MPLTRVLGQGGLVRRALQQLRMRRAVWQAEMRRRGNSQRLAAPVPKAISLSLTTRCNRGCAFCGAPETRSGSDLREDLARKVIAEAERLGVSTIILVGGEPLLRDGLVSLLVNRYPKMLFLLFTAMASMSREMARKVSTPNLLTLVATDDKGRRGQAVRQELRRAGAAFGFSSVVSEASADGLSSPEFPMTMLNEGCRIGILLERLPVGRAAGLGYGLSTASRAVFREQIRQMERETGLPLRFFPDGEDDFGGCSAAARGILHINAGGGVEACPFIHETVANLHGRSLSEVLQSPSLDRIRRVASLRSANHPCALLAAQCIADPENAWTSLRLPLPGSRSRPV